MSLSMTFCLPADGSQIVGGLRDSAGAPLPFTAYAPQTGGAIPTYRKNGGSSIALPDPAMVDVTNVSCLITWIFPPGTFTNTDVVTISAVTNTFGGTSGFAPAITNQGATNCVGGTLFPTPPPAATLRAGINVSSLGLSGLPFFACHIENCVGIIYQGSDPGPPAYTADQFPTFTHYDSYRWEIAAMPISTSGDGKAFAGYPNGGTSTLIHSGGVGSLLYVAPATGSTVSFVSQHGGASTGNTVKFISALDGSGTLNAPAFNVVILGGNDIVPSTDPGRTSHTGGWTSQTGAGFNGGYWKNDRLSTSVWTWNFGNLPAGSAYFCFSWPALAGNTQNAVYTVKENGTIIGTLTVDQTGAATSALVRDWNFTAIGYTAYGTLPAITTTGGVITVELHGDALGDCVADSVQWKLVSNTTGSVPFTPVTKLKLYDPTIADPLNPPRFHPNADLAYAGMLSLRSMQLQTSMGAAVNYADYATATQATYGAGGRNVYYSITKIEIYPNLDGYYDASNPPILVTLASVHGSPLPLPHALYVILPGGAIDLPYATGGGVVNVAFLDGRIQYDPARMASNQFAIQSYGHSGTGTVNPIFPTGAYLQVNYRSIPWPDYFLRVATLPDCDAYVCGTLLWTQACTEQVARDYLANMPAGRKCYLELGNEHWNSTGAAFPDYKFLFNEGVKAGLSITQLYCQLVAQRHAWFKAILDAVGRGGELIRIYGGQETAPGAAGAEILAYSLAHGAPIDAIVIADYFSYYPYGMAGLGTLMGSLTAAQLADGAEAEQAVGLTKDVYLKAWKTLIDNHNAAHGTNIRLGGYEGGCPWFAAGGGSTIEARQSINAKYHPQTRKTAMGHMAQLQSVYGWSFFNQYTDTQPPGGDVGNNSVYGIHLTYASRPGRGDGTDSLHNNLPDIAGVPPGPFSQLSVSPIAGGLRDWNASIGGGGGGGGGGTYKPSGAWEDGGFQNLGGIA